MSRLLNRRRSSTGAPHPQARLDAEQLSVAWQSASLLLSYPDEQLLDQLPVVEAASGLLPTRMAEPLRQLTGYLGTTPLPQLQAEYVETFDTRRRTNLFLTYFAHGDTRKRGMALLRFKQTYLRAGYQLPETGDGAELPDHLCVVLEFGATVDANLGWRLLIDHRAGLELLRIALRDTGSPWAAGVEVVTATLPPLRGEEMDAVRRLAAAGPPEEEVGLSGYGAPELDGAFAGMPGAMPGGPPIGLPDGSHRHHHGDRPDPQPAAAATAEPLPFPTLRGER